MKKIRSIHFYLLLILILGSLMIIAGCGGGSGDGGGGDDNTGPTIVLVYPANGDVNIPLNQKIGVSFNKDIDPSTINSRTFILTQGATNIPGYITYEDKVAIFAPTHDLAPNTTYTAEITTGVTDIGGNSLANGYIWSFSTGAESDDTQPTITLVNPLNLATGVPINQKITATFSKVMNPATINTTTFTLEQGGTPVVGVVTYIGQVATFTPSGYLAPSTTYTATVTTGAKDPAGNSLEADYVWSFTTGASADTTAPTVTLVNPLNLATGVPTNQKIAATFSEEMNPLTITSASFTLKQGTTSVSGIVSYIGLVATFTPSANLAANTTYTATITTVAEDLAGNALAADYVWSFTTESTADTTAPKVTLVNPSNNATGVFLNKKIAASFSKAMDPLTITTATFTLKRGSTPVTGVVTYIGQVATFTPSVNLTANTLYTATVTTGAKDLAGNALEADYVWSFTTGVVADTTAPTVILEIPTDLATGVPTNQSVSATFSEEMDPATITNTTFTLYNGLIPVTGVVTYLNRVATFKPSINLLPNTTYTATVTTGAKDLAGNALLASFVWSFTTGDAPDTSPPTVILVNPADLATGVPINRKVNATFSKAMDPLTITTANFKVTGPGITPVTGLVTYDLITNIATFAPSLNFAPNTTFTATITTGAKDLAGNPLANDYVWSFTTGTLVAQEPINLGSAGAFAVLARSTISSTGVCQINGDVGLNPGSDCNLPPPQVNGTIYIQTIEVIEAQLALLEAYNEAANQATNVQVLPGNMGGLTFTPGLYENSTSVLISGGNVTLDAQGDSSGVFVFKMGSTLTTGPGSQVILAGGTKATNVYWQVGSSATLDTTSIFKGNILAAVSITANTGSVIEGRLLGGSNTDGSVTLNATTVTLPLP